MELSILISVDCGCNEATREGVTGSALGRVAGFAWGGVAGTTLLNGFGSASGWRSSPAITISSGPDCGNGKIVHGDVVGVASMMATSRLLVVTKVESRPQSTGPCQGSAQPNLVTTRD